MKAIVVRLLLFFYLTSTYLGATHIHHDGLESLTDCKVHVMIKNLNSADMPDVPFELLGCVGCFESIVFYGNYFVQPLYKGFNAQAPPTLS